MTGGLAPTDPGQRRPTRVTARDLGRGVLLATIVLFAVNLRAPFTSLAPVVSDLSAELHLTPAAAGLLTGVPVLCFALVTPFAAAFVTRAGTAFAGTVTLVGVLAGTVLRSTGGFGLALAGSILIGAAITVGNVTIPVVVARDFSSGIPAAMGAASAAMNVGSVITTVAMAPLANAIGWRWALTAWSVVVVVGLVVWQRTYGSGLRSRGVGDERTPAARDETGAPQARPPVLRRPLTWALLVVFAAQSGAYYGLTAWLPTLLHDETGMSIVGSGAAAALFQGFGILGSVLAPLALSRMHPRAVTALVALAWLALPAGLLLAPTGWSVWASLGGIAQAANFTVVMAVIATVAGSQAAVARMSAAVQTGGYLVAATAPSVLGAIHTATGGWRTPLLVVLVTLLVMATTHVVAIGALVRHRAALAAPPDGTLLAD